MAEGATTARLRPADATEPVQNNMPYLFSELNGEPCH